jgi:pimeloyl-ACP methyl ester carboxylesterase
MPTFTAPSGSPIAYERRGRGAPVLLIMGFTTPGSAWSHQVDDLAQDHDVVWFDNRGIGGSGAPPGPWTMVDFASDALALLDHLGIDRAHVAGQSMGGMIAQHVALAAPTRVRSLGLLATHAGGPRAQLPPLAALPWLVCNAVGSSSARVTGMSRLLFPASARANGGMALLRPELERDYGQVPPRSVLWRQWAAIRGHDTRARLGELAGRPVAIVRPGQDILIAPHHSDELHAAIPGSRLLRLDHAGHGAIRQCAGEVNGLLREVFAEA